MTEAREHDAEIGRRLREARKASGYKTQLQFTDTHGLNNSTYSAHERGTRRIPPETLSLYADLLGVGEVWLRYGIPAEAEPLLRDLARLTPDERHSIMTMVRSLAERRKSSG